MRWINHFYAFYNDFWDLQLKSSHSPLLKKLIYIRKLMLEKFGDIVSAKIALENWSEGEKFSTRDAYEVLRPKRIKRSWASMVRVPSSSLKHSFVFWMATLDRLPIELNSSFLDINPSCSMCDDAYLESTHHIFFNC